MVQHQTIADCVIAGGYYAPSTNVNAIDINITIATGGNAQDFGDLGSGSGTGIVLSVILMVG